MDIKREPPITATEIEEEYKKFGAAVHKALDPFLKHIITRCTEIMVREGHISDKQIEEIAHAEINAREAEVNARQND